MRSDTESVLIYAPFGRDGLLLHEALKRGQFTSRVCKSFNELCVEADNGVGALLIADEVFGPAQVAQLSEILNRQPPWSDITLIVMTSGGNATKASQRRVKMLAELESSMTLLERPLRSVTLLSTVRSVLAARRRQYQVRDLLENEKRNAASLAQANKALQESNEGLTQFAYAASHDLQEPLRTVATYTQLLARRYKGKLDEQADEFIQFASEGAIRMKSLIEDLLHYAQVTTGSSEAESRSDGNLAVDAVANNLKLLISETQARINCSKLPTVAVHLSQLTQLFQNLIGNAIKYKKPSESPEININATREGAQWRFTVQDNGMGFPQQHAEQVFGVFKRLHGTDVPGTGIGLAVCRRIVEHYGGRIWATSVEGEGSAFEFTVPAID